MTLSELIEFLTKLAGILFVVTSMLAMGLSLTMPQIMKPLSNIRLVIVALIANFILVPMVAYIITLLVPMDQSLKIGLIVLSTAAGAPFLPKLVQFARGSIAFGVGLMVLLMIVTIVYLPVVLPLLLPNVDINAWDIAKSLIVLMLVPLAIGLMIRANDAALSAQYAPAFNKASTLALVALMVLALGANIDNIIEFIGTGALISLVVFILISLVIGYLLGGREHGSVMGLGTAQRNVSAAIVVATINFAGTSTVIFVLVGAIIMLLVLLPAARQFGRRAAFAQSSAPASGTAEPAA